VEGLVLIFGKGFKENLDQVVAKRSSVFGGINIACPIRKSNTIRL
jgi:hypothetical protein